MQFELLENFEMNRIVPKGAKKTSPMIPKLSITGTNGVNNPELIVFRLYLLRLVISVTRLYHVFSLSMYQDK